MSMHVSNLNVCIRARATTLASAFVYFPLLLGVMPGDTTRLHSASRFAHEAPVTADPPPRYNVALKGCAWSQLVPLILLSNECRLKYFPLRDMKFHSLVWNCGQSPITSWVWNLWCIIKAVSLFYKLIYDIDIHNDLFQLLVSSNWNGTIGGWSQRLLSCQNCHPAPTRHIPPLTA